MEPKNPSEPSFAQRGGRGASAGSARTGGDLWRTGSAGGASPAARTVGMLMARNPYGELLPCHRVVSASGELSSRSFRQEQARRLRAEGVEVVDFHVDLSRYGWDGRSRS